MGLVIGGGAAGLYVLPRGICGLASQRACILHILLCGAGNKLGNHGVLLRERLGLHVSSSDSQLGVLRSSMLEGLAPTTPASIAYGQCVLLQHR